MIQLQRYDNEQIYSSYYPKVFQYLSNRAESSQDAEDLAQTVFLKVYQKIDTFDEKKSSLSTWIFNITRNTLIDHQRAMRFRTHSELNETLEDGNGHVLDNLIMENEQKLLANALNMLELDERDVIVLHYYNEYTLMKISELMKRPYGQIKRLHVKALQKLKKCIE